MLRTAQGFSFEISKRAHPADGAQSTVKKRSVACLALPGRIKHPKKQIQVDKYLDMDVYLSVSLPLNLSISVSLYLSILHLPA